MANYVALNAGLNQAGDFARGASNFLLQQDRNDIAREQLALQQERQQEALRLQRGQAFARRYALIDQQSIASGKPVHQIVDENPTVKAEIAKSLFDSDARLQTLAEGRQFDGVEPGTDGRSRIRLRDANGAVSYLGGKDGDLSFSAEDLSAFAELYTAGFGRANVREAYRVITEKHKNKQLSDQDFAAQRGQLQDILKQLNQGLQGKGADLDQATLAYLEGPSAFLPGMSEPKPSAKKELSDREVLRNLHQATLSYLNEPPPFLPEKKETKGNGHMEPPPTTTVSEQPPSQARVPQGEKIKTGLSAPVTRARPHQIGARAKQAIEVFGSSPKPNFKYSDADRAAAYTNMMFISGQQPDQRIIANLLSGDDPAGTYRALVKNQAEAYGKVTDQNRKDRDQYMEEVKFAQAQISQTAENYARERLSGQENSETYDDDLAKRKAEIELAVMEFSNTFKMIGIDPTRLSRHPEDYQVVAKVASDFVEHVRGAEAYNINKWFWQSPARKKHMAEFLNKHVLLANPQVAAELAFTAARAKHPEASAEQLRQEAAELLQQWRNNGPDA